MFFAHLDTLHQDPCSDFRKAIQEHVKLHGCTVKDVDRVNFELVCPVSCVCLRVCICVFACVFAGAFVCARLCGVCVRVRGVINH